MDCSILLKNDEEVPCALVTFTYEASSRTFYNVHIKNFSLDVHYRVHPDQRPPRGVLRLQVDNPMDCPPLWDCVSDIRIWVPNETEVTCQQCNDKMRLYWNTQTLPAHCEYVMVPYRAGFTD